MPGQNRNQRLGRRIEDYVGTATIIKISDLMEHLDPHAKKYTRKRVIGVLNTKKFFRIRDNTYKRKEE